MRYINAVASNEFHIDWSLLLGIENVLYAMVVPRPSTSSDSKNHYGFALSSVQLLVFSFALLIIKNLNSNDFA
jgi:hypothetical protein